jgi:integrase
LDNDLIEKSPIRDRHKPTVERVEKRVWSPKQVKQILENTPERYGVFFQVLALTGVRAGEILGLQWKHVDLAKEQMQIEQSLWRGQLIAPKTKGSIRTINLGAVLFAALKRHRESAERKKPNDFVFCKKDGFPFASEGRVVSDARQAWYTASLGCLRFPRVQAFGGKLHQCPDGKPKACAESLGTFHDQHDSECLHARFHGIRTRGSTSRRTGDLW